MVLVVAVVCAGGMGRGSRRGAGRRGRGAAAAPVGPPRVPVVVLDGLAPEEEARARDVVRLLGARVSGGSPSDEGVPALVLVGDPGRGRDWGARTAPGPAGAGPLVVVVGEGGTLRLPGDEDLLAELVAVLVRGAGPGRGPGGNRGVGPGQGVGPGARGVGVAAGGGVAAGVGGASGIAAAAGVGMPADRSADGRATAAPGRRLVVGVAAWHGGGGATSLAVALARGVGAALVDVAGPGPGVLGARDELLPGVRWADLDPAEPSFPRWLEAQLPVVGGVPVLAGDPRGWAHPGDPRVRRVVAALRTGRDVVVDLGRWDDRCADACREGVVDVVCLVGDAGEESAVRLAGVLGACPCSVPVVVAHRGRRASALLARVVEGGVPVWSFPRPRSGGLPRRRIGALWDVLVSVEAARWAASWGRTG